MTTGRPDGGPSAGWTPVLAGALLAVLGVVLLIVGFGFGFGIGTACSNHFRCTADACPSVCDRVSIGVWLNTFGQLAVIVWGGAQALRRRRFSGRAAVVAGVSAGVCVVSYLLARSWELMA